jgi:hypothetical protein
MNRLFIIAALSVATVLGCGREKLPPKPGAPPVSFSFRKSQVLTKGMVAGIQNTGDEPLSDIVVQVGSPKEEGSRSHRVGGPIRPDDTITVGWVELDGWKLKPNDKMSVKCAEYTDAATAVVPEL